MQAIFDPEMSEWGNPIWSNVQSFFTEYIGKGSDTQGSETSQYLEEKKSTEIP